VSPRVLVAGVGNIFQGDDGFGVEVVQRLRADALPDGVVVADYGIRGLHLAFALLEPLDLLVVADALPRGGTPGTLYVLEPDLETGLPPAEHDAHGMSLPSVFASVRAMGGRLPRVLIVGCEPADVGEGLGLSPPVAGAVGPAAALVRELVARELRPPAAHGPDCTAPHLPAEQGLTGSHRLRNAGEGPDSEA
jgi:hydrogenase maturation protease